MLSKEGSSMGTPFPRDFLTTRNLRLATMSRASLDSPNFKTLQINLELARLAKHLLWFGSVLCLPVYVFICDLTGNQVAGSC